MNPVTREPAKALIHVEQIVRVALFPSRSASLDRKEVVIAPPSLYLLYLKDILKPEIKLSAQNAYFKTSGAFTGEIKCAPPFFAPRDVVSDVQTARYSS